MSGYVGDLSASQLAALDRFRQRVSDVTKLEHTDHFLLRWLRAREFDEVKAEHMLRESLEWRRKVGADTILTEYKPTALFVQLFPGGHFEASPEGHITYIAPIGRIDIKGFLEVVPVEDIMRHIIWLMEGLLDLLRQSSKKLGKHVETNFFVVDLENFSIRQLYSWKYGWKAALLERHDPDAFPQHWGGNMVGPDGDPRCTHLICPGGELPDSYREALAKSRLTCESGATLHHIGRRSRWELPVQVSRSGEQLSWCFQTASGDLTFGLRYESPFGGSMAEYLIERQRLSSCSLFPERGRLVCEKPGNYVLEFDNSYSWVTAKTLAYIVEVLPPSEEEEEASCL